MSPTRKYRRAAAIAVAATAALALPATAGAAITADFNDQRKTVTFTGDLASDTLVIGEANGLLTQTVNGGAPSTDFDGTTLPADNTINLAVNAGDGADVITIETANLASVSIDGQEGTDTITGGADDDLLRGGPGADTLNGGDGDDRIIGDTGGDTMNGGNQNDVMVWNPGDGSDVMNGDANTDDIELNGGSTGEDFKASNSATAGRVIFERLANTANGAFTLDGGTVERLVLNANGGDDTMAGDPAVTVPMLLNGAAGSDTLTGGAAADFINGGDDADTLTGNDGPDRIVGDRGGDTMAGSSGEDTLVWNNGDGSDKMDGEAGLDRIEVNGATNGATISDAFTIAPNGARAKFDRTNFGQFTLDIGSSEALDVRGQNGDDTLVASPGTGALLAVTADGGSGNDTFTGAEEADTFFGGTGNDTLTGGAGPDLLDGQDDNDTLLARDAQGDVARGGAGTDSAQTDLPGVDVVDAVESVDALVAAPIVAPPAADTRATAARIAGGRKPVRIRNGRASTRLAISCPAAEAGGCVGTVALLTSRPVRIGGDRVFVVLGNARYNLRAGQRRVVTVNLGRASTLRRIDRKRNIAVRAQTITRDAARNTASGSRSLTLRLPR